MNFLFRRRLLFNGSSPVALPPSPPSIYDTPLSLYALSDGDIVWSASDASIERTVEYSLNGGEWTEITSKVGNSAPKISVSTGDEVQFRGNNDSYGDASNSLIYSGFKGTTAEFEVRGNIMSLINSSNFGELDSFPEQSKDNFAGLFYECNTLQAARELLLPAKVLKEGSYRNMFYHCTSLANSPSLSDVSEYGERSCYQMFKGCGEIEAAMPQTNVTLAESCFEEMYMMDEFTNQSIEISFNSPGPGPGPGPRGARTVRSAVINLPRACFKNMFNGCDFHQYLNCSIYVNDYISIGPECFYGMFSNSNVEEGGISGCVNDVALSEYCFAHMFDNLKSTEEQTSIEFQLLSTTLAPYCYDSMFKDCNTLYTRSYASLCLPAPILVEGCYKNMFDGCSNVSGIDCWATDISALDSTTNWVRGVANSGIFGRHVETDSWQTGVNGIPVGWTEDLYIPGDMPLSFKILSPGNIIWKHSLDSDSGSYRAIEYNINEDSQWTEIVATAAGVEIPVSTGDIIRFRGDNYSANSLSECCFFNSTCNFKVYGNLGSLNGFTGDLRDNGYNRLFENALGLVDASGLALLLTGREANGVYQQMFYGCTGLRRGPSSFTASYIGNSSYKKMFCGCTSLEVAPDLLAYRGLTVTNIGNSCYESMFEGCTSLTQVPTINATSLSDGSCKRMFYGCTGITGFKSQFRNTGADSGAGCCGSMFEGCTSLVEANVRIKPTTSNGHSFQRMFKDCTSLTVPPDLAAATVQYGDYSEMFSGCTALTSITLPATTVAAYAYSRMFSGCTSLSSITCLATSIHIDSSTASPTGTSTYHWVENGVPSTGTFTKIAGVAYPTTEYSGIPEGWTVVEITS